LLHFPPAPLCPLDEKDKVGSFQFLPPDTAQAPLYIYLYKHNISPLLFVPILTVFDAPPPPRGGAVYAAPLFIPSNFGGQHLSLWQPGPLFKPPEVFDNPGPPFLLVGRVSPFAFHFSLPRFDDASIVIFFPLVVASIPNLQIPGEGVVDSFPKHYLCHRLAQGRS